MITNAFKDAVLPSPGYTGVITFKGPTSVTISACFGTICSVEEKHGENLYILDFINGTKSRNGVSEPIHLSKSTVAIWQKRMIQNINLGLMNCTSHT